MNLAAISITVSLLGLAYFTLPYGLVIVAALIWLWRRG